MPLHFPIQITGEEIIQALSWTLIHSLWQGMLLSVVAGCIIFFTKKANPSLRYNLLTGSLLIFVIATATTFSLAITKAAPVIGAASIIESNTISIAPVTSPLFTEREMSFTDKAVALINSNALLIVMCWLLLIGLQFIRLTAGLYGIYQIRRRQVFSAGEYWNHRIVELGQQLKMSKRVQLLQSGLIKIPAVVGYLKPVILFPAAMLSSLRASEVEAILMHELAHIRRKDFLVNVMQNIIEIIFFFNPAVLWVSSLIKSERENCCDDIALTQAGNKQNYIKALMSFQEFSVPAASSLATAFSGEKYHLMNRIKRIIYNNNKTLNNMEKKFLVSGMIVTSVFIFAFSSNSEHSNGVKKGSFPRVIAMSAADKTVIAMQVPQDTLPAGPTAPDQPVNGKINTTVDGKKYTLIADNNKVRELYVNGKKIPSEKMGDYTNITKKLLKQAKLDAMRSDREWEEAALGMQQSKKDMEQYQLKMELAEIAMEQAQKDMERNIENVKIEIEESTKDLSQAKIDKEVRTTMEQYQNETAKEIEKVKMEIELSKRDLAQAKIDKDVKIEIEKYLEDRTREMKQAKKDMEQYQKQMIQSKEEMEQAKIEMAKAKKDMEQSKILQNNIINDFIKENIIKNKADLSGYKLNNEELIVNGVKQPDAVHKKFKDKYVKNDNWSMMYNNNDNVR